MSAPTLRGRAPALRGPDWVTGRLHRRSLWAALVILVLLVGALLGLWWITNAAHTDFAATGCPVNDGPAECDVPTRHYWDAEYRFRALLQILDLLLPVLPAAVGAFVSGPVIARELENGTYKLAWTQSGSPARWLLSRLALPTVWAVTLTAAFTVAYRLAWVHGPHLVYEAHWYDDFYYLGLGPVLVGYVVLGIAAGALVALLTRGTAVAMAVTAVAVEAILLAFSIELRGLLLPVTRVTGEEQRPDNSWVVDWGRVEVPGAPGTHTTYHEYHPSSHFWPLQLIETGVLLALAALAVLAAFRVLRRLHA
ncbi:ABC transporter permease [Streptomyces sp. NBC_01429]|uniref:ABC transporter permease n=1 Tax=Streptomyces sp. NBC_01429 TaxID=2903862 RepID=UPI002E2DE993|nr:ABC transporter permease [Streptomyces sp. NBC_01429]